MDSTAKRTRFLEHVSSALALEDVEVLTGRAETLAHYPDRREKYDVVVSRAVAALPVLAELCLPFCSVGGVFVAQKRLDVDEEVRRSANAVSTMGGRIMEVREISYEGSDGPRTLVVVEKVKATPSAYPRRPGIPAKRPIGVT